MKKLLGFELRKVLKMKAMWISLIVAVLSVAAFGVISLLVSKNADSVLGVSVSTKGFANTFLTGGIVAMVLAVLVTIIVCDDKKQGTLKNIMAKGYSRKEIYAAKYVSSLMAVTIIALACYVVSIILGFTMMQDFTFGWNNVVSFLLSMVGLVALHAVFFGVSQSVEKQGVAMAINLIVPFVLSLTLGGLDAIQGFKELGISQCTVSSALSAFSKFDGMSFEIGRALIVCGAFTGLFLGGSYLINMRKEA